MSNNAAIDIKREFAKSVLGIIGITIIAALIIISIVTMITIPTSTFEEWNSFPGFSMSDGSNCQSCHMKIQSDGHHDHSFVGVDFHNLSSPINFSSQEYLKIEEQADENARKICASYSRKLREGTDEWDILYNKHYEEHLSKYGLY